MIVRSIEDADAIAAARELLLLHPDAGGFSLAPGTWHLAPGAHRSQALDIMSVRPDPVGAEASAAVSSKNNKKLAADLAKLKTRGETHRYVFFLSPSIPSLRDKSVWKRAVFRSCRCGARYGRTRGGG